MEPSTHVDPASLGTAAASVCTTTASCSRSPKKVGPAPSAKHASSEARRIRGAVNVKANGSQSRKCRELVKPAALAKQSTRQMEWRLGRTAAELHTSRACPRLKMAHTRIACNPILQVGDIPFQCRYAVPLSFRLVVAADSTEGGRGQRILSPIRANQLFRFRFGDNTGMMDGTSTHATNSSASSPSYSQQTFALTQPPMDPHMLPGGLPFPQPDPHFAYAYHPSAQGDHHLDLPPPRNMAAGVVRSRPPTAGEEEVPWWMYRAGYSPNPGHPYEPPPPVGHPAEGSHLQSATPGIYSDYTQYLAQPSPFMLGTPGAGPGHQNSPAFVWHNNATSYRDYMATQQADNYHNLSSAQASHQIPRSQEGHQHQQPTLPAPSLHHHHSVPYLQTSTSVTAANPAPHSAPLPLSSVSDAHGRPSQQEEKDRDWRRSHVHDSHSGGHYALATTNDHRGHEVDFRRDMQHSEGDLRVDRVPSLGYESGSCRMTSSDSIPSVHRLPTPISIGTIADRGMHRYDSKDYSQSNVQLHDAPLRERRSTSFDQVISRASPINLKMPEDRQKRKFTSEI